MSNVVIARIANTQILGVLASSKPVMVGDVPHYFVYWPSTPVPASGFSYLVPCEDVVDIDISVEEMTRVYVSFGSLGPIIMNSKKQLYLGRQDQLPAAEPEEMLQGPQIGEVAGAPGEETDGGS